MIELIGVEVGSALAVIREDGIAKLMFPPYHEGHLQPISDEELHQVLSAMDIKSEGHKYDCLADVIAYLRSVISLDAALAGRNLLIGDLMADSAKLMTGEQLLDITKSFSTASNVGAWVAWIETMRLQPEPLQPDLRVEMNLCIRRFSQVVSSWYVSEDLSNAWSPRHPWFD